MIDGYDELFADADRHIIRNEKASIGVLQRTFCIGFNRASRIMNQLQSVGVVGSEEETGSRSIRMTISEFETFLEENPEANCSAKKNSLNPVYVYYGYQALDELFADASRFVIRSGKASIGMIQRQFKIGFNKASQILDQMYYTGVVGPDDGVSPRQILMSIDDFECYLEHNPERKYRKKDEPEEDYKISEDNPEKEKMSEKLRTIENCLVPSCDYDDPLDFLDIVVTECSPNRTKMILMDQLGIFGMYNSSLLLYLPSIKEIRKIDSALGWARAEMMRRKELCIKSNVRRVSDLNDKRLHHILIIFREIMDIAGDEETLKKLEELLPVCGQFDINIIAFSQYRMENIPYHRILPFFKQRKNSGIMNILKNQAETKAFDIENIDGMSGKQFEYFCADVLFENGYENVSVTTISGDYGGDIICEKDQVRYVIQCKRYESAVGIGAVQEVIASKSIYKTHVAVVLTNRYFTKSAQNLAEANNVLLWDREYLQKLIDS